MPTVLITGAGRGIGLEFTRQYAAAGWTVLAALRDPAAGEALNRMTGAVTRLPLDVADAGSIAALADRLRGTPIDLLINNAGLYGPTGVRLTAIDHDAWQRVMAVNLYGPVRMTQAFLDHLRAGRQRKIVALTSRMGSIADNTSGGGYIYRSSKAALNAGMRSLAIDLAGEGFSVGILHPGWVQTDMGGPKATLSPSDSVDGMRRVIDALGPQTSGRFLNYDGREIPW